MSLRISVFLSLFFLLAGAAADVPPETIALREALVIEGVGTAGRVAVHDDAIEALIVGGRWSHPVAGGTVALPDGSLRAWTHVSADVEGSFGKEALHGGYVYFTVHRDEPCVMMLNAAGHNMVYVNNEPRVGDPYRYGFVRLPIALHAGDNELLFHVTRGSLHAELRPPRAPVMLDPADATLPDLIVGEDMDTWGAVLVINADPSWAQHLVLQSARSDAGSPAMTRLPPIPPLGVRKVVFPIRGPVVTGSGAIGLTLNLIDDSGPKLVTLDSAALKLQRRRPDENYRRTFISEIDGSVQFYAVVPPATPVSSDHGANGAAPPATPATPATPAPALVLSLHGAGVNAVGQAACYAPKDWAAIVAPTNRRPYGFDWEDWGRLDALEVLDQAQRTLGTDPLRTYLTGHSMGGHGTWHLGSMYPDRFAAIGPSAGWRDFWSYSGDELYEIPDVVESILLRAVSPSDTLSRSRNFLQFGVYVLHGDADDNVPVAQARAMRQQLSAFHPDFAYYERRGAGHWWDDPKTPGTDCVDWRPMFEFFSDHSLHADRDVDHVEFVTNSPGVSASCHWATIETQTQQFVPSSINLTWVPGTHRLTGTTLNVGRLSIDLAALGADQPVAIDLDGSILPEVSARSSAGRIWLGRDHDSWTDIDQPAPALKGPHRCGPFKDAFRHHMVLVYGTQGTAEENAWSLVKARYDAETFWYRGNGSIDIVADTSFDAGLERDRSVILYGNADTNAAWSRLLEGSPVQVRRGVIAIGQRRLEADDLACLFIRPRPGSDLASVGVVAGSGLRGMRLTERVPYFVSGIAYPDCTVIGPEAMAIGSKRVRVAGYFDDNWAVEDQAFAWRDPEDRDQSPDVKGQRSESERDKVKKE